MSSEDYDHARGVYNNDWCGSVPTLESWRLRAEAAEQALTDLRGKVSDEYERAVTLCENSPSIGAGRILTGLWRLYLAAGGASTTTPETEK